MKLKGLSDKDVRGLLAKPVVAKVATHGRNGDMRITPVWFKAIDGEGFARVDMFLPDGGEPIINEINTLPGFRPVSMFPRLWDVAGVPYSALITRIVELGLARHERTQRKDPSHVREGAGHG